MPPASLPSGKASVGLSVVVLIVLLVLVALTGLPGAVDAMESVGLVAPGFLTSILLSALVRVAEAFSSGVAFPG